MFFSAKQPDIKDDPPKVGPVFKLRKLDVIQGAAMKQGATLSFCFVSFPLSKPQKKAPPMFHLKGSNQSKPPIGGKLRINMWPWVKLQPFD